MIGRAGVDILLVLALAMVIAGLPSCAAVPECEEFSIGVVETRQGRMFLLDQENLAKVFKRQRDLQAGTCRLPDRQGIGTGA